MRTAVLRVAGVGLAGALTLAACSSDPDPVSATVAEEPSSGVVAGADAAALATNTSATLFESAPVAVASGSDLDSQARGASLAVALGVPVVVGADSAAEELDRLDTETVLAVGDEASAWAEGLGDPDVVAAPEDPADLAALTGRTEPFEVRTVAEQDLVAAVADLEAGGSVLLTVQTEEGAAPDPASPDAASPETATPEAATSEESPLPPTELPEPLTGVLVLASTDAGALPAAAAATSRASGADVTVMAGYDPRADATAIADLEGSDAEVVLGLGDGFGAEEQFGYRVGVAADGAELPGGGKLVLPGRLMVALYGHPGVPVLGVMGETGPEEAVERARQQAAEYEPYSDVPVVPTFEIITTVAAAQAGSDGNYTNETDISVIQPWVDIAGESDMYVALDLQPGKTSFLDQAKLYEELLKEPHVGLALDPEWRLKPDQPGYNAIGTVTAEEINSVIDYLADLVVEHELPQKLLIVHQFRFSMISDRETIKTDVDQVAVLDHVDGFGTPEEKYQTYNYLTEGVEEKFFWGWKNFIDEDQPTFTPEETMTTVNPTPDFVSYQ